MAPSRACHAHFSWKVCFFTFIVAGLSLIEICPYPSRTWVSTIRAFKKRIVGCCITISCWENWRNVKKTRIEIARSVIYELQCKCTLKPKSSNKIRGNHTRKWKISFVSMLLSKNTDFKTILFQVSPISHVGWHHFRHQYLQCHFCQKTDRQR